MVFDPDKQLEGNDEEFTANELFFDAMIRHQIGLLSLAGSITNEILAILDATETGIKRRILDGVNSGAGYTSPAGVRKLNKMLKDITAIRAAAWKSIAEILNREMLNLAVEESKTTDGILKTAMLVLFSTNLPTKQELQSIVKSMPFEGKTLKQWVKSLFNADIGRIVSQIKIGLTQGENAIKVATRVVGRSVNRGRDGTLEKTRRQTSGVTRTAVVAISNASRLVYNLANKDIFVRELYVATLDSRTTEICSSLDGQIFDIGVGPKPPIHFNCRSLRVGITDDVFMSLQNTKPSTEKQLLAEFSRSENITTVTRRSRLPHGTKLKFDKFSRMRVKELTGKAPAKTSYHDFLKRQPAEFQDNYLGKAKGRLFRQGVPLTKFVDPAGRPIPLDQLAKTDKKAFVAAGLDPEDFL